jgi:hypothetical protein
MHHHIRKTDAGGLELLELRVALVIVDLDPLPIEEKRTLQEQLVVPRGAGNVAGSRHEGTRDEAVPLNPTWKTIGVRLSIFETVLTESVGVDHRGIAALDGAVDIGPETTVTEFFVGAAGNALHPVSVDLLRMEGLDGREHSGSQVFCFLKGKNGVPRRLHFLTPQIIAIEACRSTGRS